MLYLFIDHTFIEAILNENNPNHKIAEKLSQHVDYKRLFLPNHELIIIMHENRQHQTESQKIFKILDETTKLDCSLNRKAYHESYEAFKTENKLDYTDYLTVRLMKEKNIQYIISFNEKFDEIPEIGRIYKVKRNSF